MTDVRFAFVEMSMRRRELLAAIAAFLDANGYSPSVRELEEYCGISSSSVVIYNLEALERAGFIQRAMEIARSIRVTELGREALASMAR